MIPVAMYFCVPLLFGAVKKKSSSPIKPSTAEASSIAENFVLPVAKITGAQHPKTLSWIDVLRRLENDSLAAPAGIAIDARNPFAARVVASPDKSLAEDEGADGVKQRDAEPERKAFAKLPAAKTNPIRNLGLQLNATVVGRRSRLATINGEMYEEGETIPVIIETDSESGTDSSEEMELELARIDRRFVLLKMGDFQHLLPLQDDIPYDAIIMKSRSQLSRQ